MARTGARSVFIDANVLIYSTVAASPLCSLARGRLLEFEREGRTLWISRQVLREYLAATTRPGAIIPPPSKETLIRTIHDFKARFAIADENDGVTTVLLELLGSFGASGKQVHDANIAANLASFGDFW